MGDWRICSFKVEMPWAALHFEKEYLYHEITGGLLK